MNLQSRVYHGWQPLSSPQKIRLSEVGQAQVIFRAEPGEIGEWEARVDFDDPATARPGQVYAFTISPKDGSIAADAVVSVRLAGRR